MVSRAQTGIASRWRDTMEHAERQVIRSDIGAVLPASSRASGSTPPACRQVPTARQ